MTAYFDKLAIENFGCIEKVEVALTHIHALIGPNDSGKTTALHAMRLALQSLCGFEVREAGRWSPFDPRSSLLREKSTIALSVGSVEYRARHTRAVTGDAVWEQIRLNGEDRPELTKTRSWARDPRLVERLSQASFGRRLSPTVQPTLGEIAMIVSGSEGASSRTRLPPLREDLHWLVLTRGTRESFCAWHSTPLKPSVRFSRFCVTRMVMLNAKRFTVALASQPTRSLAA